MIFDDKKWPLYRKWLLKYVKECPNLFGTLKLRENFDCVDGRDLLRKVRILVENGAAKKYSGLVISAAAILQYELDTALDCRFVPDYNRRNHTRIQAELRENAISEVIGWFLKKAKGKKGYPKTRPNAEKLLFSVHGKYFPKEYSDGDIQRLRTDLADLKTKHFDAHDNLRRLCSDPKHKMPLKDVERLDSLNLINPLGVPWAIVTSVINNK